LAAIKVERIEQSVREQRDADRSWEPQNLPPSPAPAVPAPGAEQQAAALPAPAAPAESDDLPVLGYATADQLKAWVRQALAEGLRRDDEHLRIRVQVLAMAAGCAVLGVDISETLRELGR
jgi:hypothetical protein